VHFKRLVILFCLASFAFTPSERMILLLSLPSHSTSYPVVLTFVAALPLLLCFQFTRCMTKPVHSTKKVFRWMMDRLSCMHNVSHACES
jgi:hypothetical protein